MSNNSNISICEMSDDELWAWWLGLNKNLQFFFLRDALKLCPWTDDEWYFDIDSYDYKVYFCRERAISFKTVKQLQQLTKLILDNHLFRDSKNILVISNLTQLTYLSLGENQIQDISALANSTHLTNLNLGFNHIQDVSVLANLTKLTVLDLGVNEIGDISILANLAQLTELDLGFNEIGDISVLANLTQLTILRLGRNQIRDQDISILANLTQLTELDLQNTPVSFKAYKWLEDQLPNCSVYY